MFVLDRLLTGGLAFVLDKVAQAAASELDDDEALRRRLLEAQMRFELGELGASEFRDIERDTLARLRHLQEERRAGGGALDSESLSGVEITVGGDEE